MIDRLSPIHPRKTGRDTPASCAERAAADLATAASSDNENIRQRFKHSAESWMARAALIERTAVSSVKG
jgi:hypothetical protein